MKIDSTSQFAIPATVAFIQEAHAGQKYNQMPYFFHPVEVAEEVTNLVEGICVYAPSDFAKVFQLVALLHDVIEDTDYTESDLRERFDDGVVDAVVLLTHNDSLDYLDNIQRIIDSRNTVAMLVKLADNRVNRRGDKSKFKPERAQRLNDRYDASIDMLTKALTAQGVVI